jgi:DNA modification methylase
MCGSGSALVAAEELGRSWIGIEIEPKWYEVAKARISELITGRAVVTVSG